MGHNSKTSGNDAIASDMLVNSSQCSSANSTQITQSQFNYLLAKLDDLKKQLTRVEVKIDQDHGIESKCVSTEHTPYGTVDISKLHSFGLPIKCKEQLNGFEAKLKTESFRNDVVSLFFQRLHIRYTAVCYIPSFKFIFFAVSNA